jgi:hypothetical protein
MMRAREPMFDARSLAAPGMTLLWQFRERINVRAIVLQAVTQYRTIDRLGCDASWLA